MTPTYHSSFPPFTIDLNEDQHHHQLIFCSKTTTEDASSSSSISYPIFINPPQEEVGYYHKELQPLHHQEVDNIYASHGRSWDHRIIKNENENGQELSVCKKEDKSTSIEDQRDNSSVKWMSSKMRLMRKMMTTDQTVNTTQHTSSMHKLEDKEKSRSLPLQDDYSSKNLSDNSNNTIRVCSDCNTTKTPLWRSGPRGPKSLCNACGIRQRKARRALAAAQASANGTIFAPDTAAMKTNKVQNKEKRTNNSHLPFKKRCKFTAQSRGSRKKLCFEDLSSTILSKNSAFQQLFPQDEKEAAILLMALSYGLVHG
ncbi:GATA transcription factor 21 [Ricinus communis]|uniref:GATA-type domain-containing protein n=1 Tax=Ricinus communis TaxID=3988 RepID=B9RK63_RICCO|nr:GATA transcription factor 21 [Ricinus communis]EEF48061.1 hypothetical protein RCOM_1046780 [Ricinus communis]|eukprot:XP_025012279.1 GATA transcription factor 21 [Ricinus communis]